MRDSNPYRGPKRGHTRNHAACAEDFDAVLDGLLSLYHLLPKAESSNDLSRFTCHRFANVKPRELFLFQNEW